ncbi:MAG: hypothetical protein K5883_09405 [Pseudobutyrivibrio sp.]|nr:hypothetical protein [Pseudobutyrivibrio sp.]
MNDYIPLIVIVINIFLVNRIMIFYSPTIFNWNNIFILFALAVVCSVEIVSCNVINVHII